MAQSEDNLTAKCYQWFHNTFPAYRDLLFHVPNGGTRNKIEAAKFKAMGVRPGIPDFLFIFMGQLYEIELKRADGGTQSDAQKHVMTLHRMHGAKYYIIDTLEKFKELMFRTGDLVRDIGSVLIGKEAVNCGLINEMGGISLALKKLDELIALKSETGKRGLQ